MIRALGSLALAAAAAVLTTLPPAALLALVAGLLAHVWLEAQAREEQDGRDPREGL